MFHSVFIHRKFRIPSVKDSVSVPAALHVVIDNYAGKEFNRNDAGWIRNDLSLLARAQSLQEYELIMSRLQEVRSQSNLPTGVTDQQAFDMVIPRFAQSPLELERYVQMSNDSVVERVNKAYERSVKDVNVDSSVEPSVVSSSESAVPAT